MRSNVESALVPSRLLGELLIEKGLITPEELEEALAEQKENGKRLGEILVKKGYVSGPALTTVLAEQLGVAMEKQTGFGSGLWSEIKRRHPRGGRVHDAIAATDPATPETPREARLQLIDGLAEAVGVMRPPDSAEPEPEAPEPAVAEEAPDMRAELEGLRQQLAFAATRLDEERAAHEGTQRLLDEARVAQAEASDAGEHAASGDLAELNETVVALRADLEARDAQLAESADARAELERVMAELESDLNELRERRTGSESESAELGKQIRDLRVENDEVKQRLIESRAAAKAATDELDALRAQLDARESELAVASEAHDRQLTELRHELAAREDARSREVDARVAAEAALAELRAEAESVAQSLDEERAAHVATRREAERIESRWAELEPLEEQMAEATADIDARTQSISELTAELEATKAALDAARSEAVALSETFDEERADARVAVDAELAELRSEVAALSQSLVEEREAHVAARRNAERFESRCAELEPLEALLAQAHSDVAERTQSIAQLTVELEAVQAELAERPAPPPVEEPRRAHVVFLPGAEGYALEARPGPAPDVGSEEELDGLRFRVTRIGRSPLPADKRQCAFLEAA
jgi:chromosome segregation ATPase